MFKYPCRIGHPYEASFGFFTAFLLRVMGEKQVSWSLELLRLMFGESILDLDTVFGVDIFSVVLLFWINCSLVISDFVQVKISSTIEWG